VGLISSLLLLPLAPVRGTVWIGEVLLEQAQAEYYDESAIRAQLMEIEVAVEAGTLSQEEAIAAEDVLVARLLEARDQGVA